MTAMFLKYARYRTTYVLKIFKDDETLAKTLNMLYFKNDSMVYPVSSFTFSRSNMHFS